MKALIFIDGSTVTSPSDLEAAAAANSCYGMGIDVDFMQCNSTAPSVAQVNGMGYDLVIVPALTSGNQASLVRFIAGTVTVPVMVMTSSYISVNTKGVVTNIWADTAADWWMGTIGRTGAKCPVVSRRPTLRTDLVSPEAVSEIISGDAVGSNTAGPATIMYRYTPDGVNFVYYSYVDPGSNGIQATLLHLMVQEAINDGVLSRPKRKAPIILNFDHLNDAGSNTAFGGIGGWQENPETLKDLGDILRRYNAIGYGSIEKSWIDGTDGTTTGALATYLQNYSDVFRYNPYHSHTVLFNSAAAAPTDPIANAISKPAIDAVVQDTITQMASIGLEPTYEVGHFATDRSNDNLWQLASPQVANTGSTDNLTVQAGYGMKVARVGDQNESWPAKVRNPGTAFPVHWLKDAHVHRGIRMVAGADGIVSTDYAEAKAIWFAMRYLFLNLNHGLFGYYHSYMFEDVAWRTANLAGAPTKNSANQLSVTYGHTAHNYMGAYCASCPDTAKFGADINNYL